MCAVVFNVKFVFGLCCDVVCTSGIAMVSLLNCSIGFGVGLVTKC